jgi:hypothetical protein
VRVVSFASGPASETRHGMRHQQANASHPLPLWGMRPERPRNCDRTTQQKNELTPPHSRPSSTMMTRSDYQMIGRMAPAIAALRWPVPNRVKSVVCPMFTRVLLHPQLLTIFLQCDECSLRATC